MRNNFKIFCSLTVLAGFVLAALACASSKSAYDDTFRKGSGGGSGKDGAILAPQQVEPEIQQPGEKQIRPEVL